MKKKDNGSGIVRSLGIVAGLGVLGFVLYEIFSAKAPAFPNQAPTLAPPVPITTIDDPRLAQALAAVNPNGTFPAAGVSAAGMPVDVRNALVAKGWIWTGSVFNPGVLYPPGTPQSQIIIAA